MIKNPPLPDFLNSEYDSYGELEYRDLVIVNTAMRAMPKKAATGGPNGVLWLKRELLGPEFKGVDLRYFFESSFLKLPKKWSDWAIQKKLSRYTTKHLLAQYTVQYAIPSFIERESLGKSSPKLFFICHDIASAVGAHLAGYQYALVYHQQGGAVHERLSFGESLNKSEINLLNHHEKIAFENAERVFFPSLGAKQSFQKTKGWTSLEQVNFNKEALYNTVVDFEVDQRKAEEFLNRHRLEYILDDSKRSSFLVFVTVGDYTSNKGVDRCPSILKKIAAKTDKKVIWICLGDAHQSGIYEEIKTNSKNYNFKSVLIPNRLPHSEAMAIVEQSDFLLMMQRHSIFDFSTLESMKLGKGVILSPQGGNLEFNREDNVIFLDPDEELSEENLKNIETKSVECGRQNQNCFNKHFSPEIFSYNYKKYYKQVIDRHYQEFRKPGLDKGFSKDIFFGKKVVICGPGLSLKKLKKDDLKGKVLVALNSALRADIDFDCHFMQDEPHEHSYWAEYLARPVKRFYGVINRGKTLDLGINFNRLDKMQIEYQNYQLGSEKFSHHVDAIQLDLENFPVADMCSVLFSALQVIAWSSPKSIELVGVDFSSVNYDQSNPNLYNVDVFNNLAVIAKLLREKDILFKTLYTESKIVELVLNSHGNCELPSNVDLPESINRFVSKSGLSKLENYNPFLVMIQSIGHRYFPKKTRKFVGRVLRKLKIMH